MAPLEYKGCRINVLDTPGAFDFEPDVQSFKDALGGDAYYDQYKDESWYDQELLDAILAEVR